MRFALPTLLTKSLIPPFLAFLLYGLVACSKSPSESSSVSSASADKSSSSNESAAKLPDVVLGDFHGILGLTESGALTQSHANARATVSAHGDRYRITFSGGIPEVPASFPTLDNLIFVVTPGSQQGLFHSVARDGSVEGIRLSTFMTNLNVEVTGMIYTGQK